MFNRLFVTFSSEIIAFMSPKLNDQNILDLDVRKNALQLKVSESFAQRFELLDSSRNTNKPYIGPYICSHELSACNQL